MSRKLIGILLLGFASGLPYMLVFSTLTAWLRDVGISLTEIGFFAWLVLTYSLKFLWAPFVDRYSIPGFKVFGKRRGWILFSQSLIFLSLFGMSLIDPLNNIQFLALLAFFVAFFGSIQDVVVDALRIEIGEAKEQGNLAASYQLGYRVAILIATSAALIFADIYSWSYVYQSMSLFILVGSAGALICHEPNNHEIAILRFDKALIEAFKEFFHRFGLWSAAILLLIISTYRLTDIVMGPMAMPFYLDLGFSKTEIGALVKTIALFGSVIGFFIGGLLVKRISLFSALLFGGFCVLITNLFFAYVASTQANISLLSLIVGFDSFAAGLVGTINIAFLTSLVSKKFTAVQYAMFDIFHDASWKIFKWIFRSFGRLLCNCFIFGKWLVILFLYYLGYVHSCVAVNSDLQKEICR
jgi:PAT family beta-lactamase induction signal transducer AmpG